MATDIWDGTRLALGGLQDFATGLVTPVVRLGITGLSRSGKTIFITALVNAFLKQTQLPLFEAQSRGRILRAFLEPQPDDDLPRFPYEAHLAALTGTEPKWPESTTRMSQLRLTVEYDAKHMLARYVHGGKLHIDIVDYPGEWLLDLPLMTKTYQEWSSQTLAASRHAPRNKVAQEWHAHLATLKANAPENESEVIKSAALFTSYLAACRNDSLSLSSLPPGRFLMPGDLAGSPLLTFAPLDISANSALVPNTLASLMARRYDSYVKHVVKPFFFGHFARLNRQIVLVDALTTLNAGATAVSDLSAALQDVLRCFRTGANSLLNEILGRKIDRILFAATKADLLHHTNHDKLESILKHIVDDAIVRAQFQGAECQVAAIAAVRATREAIVKHKGDKLKTIVGVPQAGEIIDRKKFDGTQEAAIFPGDLPANPQQSVDGSLEGQLRFVRFKPLVVKDGMLPYIRLDRAIEYLLGNSFI